MTTTTDTSAMFWTATGSGQYERLFDGQDQTWVRMCLAAKAYKREHWAVNVFARIETGHGEAAADTQAVAERLKRAWVQIRFQHPFIASTLGEGRFLYQTADATVLEEWLAESFAIETTTVSEFINHAQLQTYSSLHYFPASSEILLRVHHWHADGIAALSLVHQILLHFAADAPIPAFGDEAQRLSPTFSDAAGLSNRAAGQEGADGLLGILLQNSPSIGIPFQAPADGPAGSRYRTLAWSKDTAAALVQGCKTLDIGVAAAVHAALTMVIQERKIENPEAKKYTSMTAFNYRPYMAASYRDPVSAPLGAYVMGLPFTRPHADFHSHARAYHQIYRTPLTEHQFDLSESYQPFIFKRAALVGAGPAPQAKPSAQPQLSSVGLIDQIQANYPGLHPVRVKHVQITPDIMAPGVMVYQWTFNDRFFLSAAYNEAFFTDATIQSLLHRSAEVLFQELRVVPVAETV